MQLKPSKLGSPKPSQTHPIQGWPELLNDTSLHLFESVAFPLRGGTTVFVARQGENGIPVRFECPKIGDLDKWDSCFVCSTSRLEARIGDGSFDLGGAFGWPKGSQ